MFRHVSGFVCPAALLRSHHCSREPRRRLRRGHRRFGSSSETPGDDNVTSGGIGLSGVRGTSSECQKAAVDPGLSPVRRLTIHEYNNTVRDLLNATMAPANSFPEEERGLGFTNNANSQSVSGLLVEAYEASAADLATAATSNLPKLMSCDPIAQGDSCVRTFLTSFGLKAYRRPLETAEGRPTSFRSIRRTSKPTMSRPRCE